MAFSVSVVPHTLRFRFAARTSRGAMQTHQVWYLVLRNSSEPGKLGIGECAPLPGLSPDFDQVQEGLTQFQAGLERQNLTRPGGVAEFIGAISGAEFPAVKFGLETALLDYQNGGNRILYQSAFTVGKKPIPINGLIWMSDKETMLAQVKEKINAGFSCLKLKIGAIDFDQELDLLRFIRSEFSRSDLTIRVDANGAFGVEEALNKLDQLAAFQLHSIEQPIKAGQWEAMAKLCTKSPVPVALDEELIGEQTLEYKKQLLSEINPPYIILKPTLVGGLASAKEWIRLAEAQGIGWWITSALESNIGLNAIAQFTAVNRPEIPQGLGTGQLYFNNIGSPLCVEQGYLHYQNPPVWDLEPILSALQPPNPA